MTAPRRMAPPVGVSLTGVLLVLGVALVALVVTLLVVYLRWHTPAMEPVPVPTVASA